MEVLLFAEATCLQFSHFPPRVLDEHPLGQASEEMILRSESALVIGYCRAQTGGEADQSCLSHSCCLQSIPDAIIWVSCTGR